MTSRAHGWLAAMALLAAFAFRAPFPWIVAVSALIGLAIPAYRSMAHEKAAAFTSLMFWPDLSRLVRVLGLGLFLWAVPFAVLVSLGGTADLFRAQYLFFSKAALVTFGGAYAVLGYVSQAAVDQFHWLSRPEVMDGLALAETTPGPLIIVLQYVGFLAGWNHPQGLAPGLSGTVGAVVTTYTTFLPSLVLVFLGAPYVDRISSTPWLSGSLSAIGASVTGVVFSLGLDYGVAVIVPLGLEAGPDGFALLVLVTAFLALWRARVDLIPVLIAGALAGPLYHFLRGFIPS
ncbi:MAG: chromate transporter [Vicinamibacteria bacterium]|nr:chromate transporter [Vicinamibacteria bacterium]